MRSLTTSQNCATETPILLIILVKQMWAGSKSHIFPSCCGEHLTDQSQCSVHFASPCRSLVLRLLHWHLHPLPSFLLLQKRVLLHDGSNATSF